MELNNTSVEEVPRTSLPVDEARVRQKRIRELEKDQIGSRDWTPKKWEELQALRVQDAAAEKVITPEMASALHRQGTAGSGGQPDLRINERNLIVQANLISQAKRRN